MISQAVFNSFCKKTANSTKSKKTICKQLKISDNSVDKFIRSSEEAERQYARAKADQAEKLLDQIWELEEECKRELLKIDDPKRCNSLVQFYKIKMDNIKWVLSKIKPKKYGDKLDLSSSDGTMKPPGELKIIVDKNVDNSLNGENKRKKPFKGLK